MRLLLCKSQVVMGKYKSRKRGNLGGFIEVPYSWHGYKLHIDTADGDIPVSCILSSASLHDSQVMMPLMLKTSAQVQYCYDLADAAYCSPWRSAASRALGHVPLIDHNPRRGEKIDFAPHEALRYKARSSAERVNGHLKDSHGGRQVWVRGADKVMAHLMFGIIVITSEQLLRLITWYCSLRTKWSLFLSEEWLRRDWFVNQVQKRRWCPRVKGNATAIVWKLARSWALGNIGCFGLGVLQLLHKSKNNNIEAIYLIEMKIKRLKCTIFTAIDIHQNGFRLIATECHMWNSRRIINKYHGGTKCKTKI